jgi:hypothetical protein
MTSDRPLRRLLQRATLAGGSIALLAAVPADAATAPVNVYPSPGSRLATRRTEIAFRGVPAAQLGTLTVTGSRSGTHSGEIEPDSDGDGASFVPTEPFDAGETVIVHTGLDVVGGHAGTFQFTVERPYGRIFPPGTRNGAARVGGDARKFVSRPDLRPVKVEIDRQDAGAQDVFLTPMRGPVQWGPMIVDRWGSLVWFDPVAGAKTWVADFRLQKYQGHPVLTWWQGALNAGLGQGYDVIFDRNYRQIASVRAADGLAADLHEFTITPQGTALTTAYSLVHWSGSSIHSRRDLSVLNCTIQEIDIPTGRVLFQWDSLDHIPLSDSYNHPPASSGHPYDYFHINSLQEDTDGNLIVSARNTWAIYKISHTSGAVMWELGGKHSTFKMGRGTLTAYQHDARARAGGLMTVFDDGSSPQVHPQSRGLLERINTTTRTASLVRAFDHSPQLLASAEGSVQLLSNNDLFVGWGDEPYFTEFNPQGHELFDGRIVGGNSSYRAYELPWSAQPPTKPALALVRGSDGVTTAYASWNGATDVAGWQLLAGPSHDKLEVLTTVRRHGFETAIRVHAEQPYMSVRALGSSRQTLAGSITRGSGRARVSIFGHTGFVSTGGIGGLLVGCFAAQPCHLGGSLSAGHVKVAQLASQSIAGNRGGTVFFKLTSEGRRLLAHAPGNQLAVNAAVRNSDGAAGFSHLNLVSYRTSGGAPAHSVTQAPSLQLLTHTGFISAGGTGGIFAGCPGASPCHVTISLEAGGSVIGTGGSQFIGAGDCAILFFKLTSSGAAMLGRAAGNDLGAQLIARDGGQTASAQVSLVRYR